METNRGSVEVPTVYLDVFGDRCVCYFREAEILCSWCVASQLEDFFFLIERPRACTVLSVLVNVRVGADVQEALECCYKVYVQNNSKYVIFGL